MTLHASKGLEFPVVFLVGCEDGFLPWLTSPDDGEDTIQQREEERRLLYVGVTRARKRLVLTHSRHRLVHGRRQERALSPFLAALPPETLARERARLPRATPKPTEQLSLI